MGIGLLAETIIDDCEHMNVKLGFEDDEEACLYSGRTLTTTTRQVRHGVDLVRANSVSRAMKSW